MHLCNILTYALRKLDDVGKPPYSNFKIILYNAYVFLNQY